MPKATSPARIVLTGASGFVGGHLIPRLRHAFPASTLVLCGAGHLELNIADRDAVQALVSQVLPDVWVNLAAISAVPAAGADPSRTWEVNLHGSLALGQAILARVPDCTLLHISSAEVYGRSFTSGKPVDETTLLAPLNTYAATKAAADLALGAMAADGLRVIRVRPFNHTGPGQSADFVIPAFARQIARISAARQAPVLTVGSLDPLRDFLDVRDVCDAYVACLVQRDDLPGGSILNVASGIPRKIGDVLARLLELAGIEVEVEHGTALYRRVEIPLACGDATQARNNLSWSPSIDWDTTLNDVLQDWTNRIAQEPRHS